MNIDTMDFTPRWSVWHSIRKEGVFILSQDECRFFDVTWHEMSPYSQPSPAKEYARKVVTYYNRFNAHMPVEIRKELLREI